MTAAADPTTPGCWCAGDSVNGCSEAHCRARKPNEPLTETEAIHYHLEIVDAQLALEAIVNLGEHFELPAPEQATRGYYEKVIDVRYHLEQARDLLLNGPRSR